MQEGVYISDIHTGGSLSRISVRQTISQEMQVLQMKVATSVGQTLKFGHT